MATNRLSCKNETGIQNPWANPDDYEDLLCPCTDGISECPANASSGELYRYNSLTTDTFYDLTNKDIPLWIVRSNKALEDHRFYYSSFTSKSSNQFLSFLLTRFGGFEFGVNNPLSNINFSQLAQGLTGLSKAARLEQSFQLNTTGRITALANDSVNLGVLDGVRVSISICLTGTTN